MSQNWFTNSCCGRKVLYGADKPTGGFFYTEFNTDEEAFATGEEVRQSSMNLTLTELKDELFEIYGFELVVPMMISQWNNDGSPSRLQHEIGKMFGYSLSERLERVEKDLGENYAS